MKKFTALALVAGLSATGAQAQYGLQYDALDGSLTILGVDSGLINYVVTNNGNVPFLETPTPSEHTNHLRPINNFLGFIFGLSSSTPGTISASNDSANETIMPSGDLALGTVLPAGLTEGEYLGTIASTEYVTALSTPKQSFTLSYVPEPTSLALLGLGGLMVARRRRSA